MSLAISRSFKNWRQALLLLALSLSAKTTPFQWPQNDAGGLLVIHDYVGITGEPLSLLPQNFTTDVLRKGSGF